MAIFNREHKISLFSLVLLFALMIPTAAQFTHSFDTHKNVSCNETEAHLHQAKVDCKICEFEVFSFDQVESTSINENVELPIVKKAVTIASLTLIGQLISKKQLRAPPFNS